MESAQQPRVDDWGGLPPAAFVILLGRELPQEAARECLKLGAPRYRWSEEEAQGILEHAELAGARLVAGEDPAKLAEWRAAAARQSWRPATRVWLDSQPEDRRDLAELVAEGVRRESQRRARERARRPTVAPSPLDDGTLERGEALYQPESVSPVEQVLAADRDQRLWEAVGEAESRSGLPPGARRRRRADGDSIAAVAAWARLAPETTRRRLAAATALLLAMGRDAIAAPGRLVARLAVESAVVPTAAAIGLTVAAAITSTLGQAPAPRHVPPAATRLARPAAVSPLEALSATRSVTTQRASARQTPSAARRKAPAKPTARPHRRARHDSTAPTLIQRIRVPSTRVAAFAPQRGVLASPPAHHTTSTTASRGGDAGRSICAAQGLCG